MKKFLLILLTFLGYYSIYSQTFQDTKGELSISQNGSSTYKVPIGLPPGIKNVGPQLALIYSSGNPNGIAGYGWNIVGVSSISKVSTRLDIDGYIDPIDFDNNDQYVLDGQRLLLQGTVNNISSFKTENYSHLKIQCKIKNKSLITLAEDSSNNEYVKTPVKDLPIIGGPIIVGPIEVATQQPEYFTVTSSDGSQSFYGSTVNSRSTTEWLIDKWIDPQGNVINYTYETTNGVLYLKKITWGINEKENLGIENSIEFIYKNRVRSEVAYLFNRKMVTNQILSQIDVKNGTSLFRRYLLTHTINDLNYEALAQIQESNGTEFANPVKFTYDNSESGFESINYSKNNGSNPLGEIELSGDFDGNGQLDFIADSRLYLNPINFDSGWTSTALPFDFTELVPSVVTTLDRNNKLAQKNSIVKIEKSRESVIFKFLNYSSNQFSQEFSKKIDLLTTYSGNNANNYQDYKYGMQTLIGDFNGDGISDIFIKHYEQEYNYGGAIIDPITGGIFPGPIQKGQTHQKYYIADTNPLSSVNVGSSGVPLISDPNRYLESDIIGINRAFIFDFNGDGKDDMLFPIDVNGNYRVIGFNYSDNNTKIETQLLWSGKFDNGNIFEKQLVWGDFNGDGKIDVMIPDADGSTNWTMYIAKGNGFQKERYENFVEYKPYWKGAPSINRVRIKQYRSVDLNKDGKSDFLVNEYESYTESINNRDGRGHLYLRPNLGADANGKIIFGNHQHTQINSSYGYVGHDQEMMHLLIGDFKNHSGSNNLAFIQGGQIWNLNYKKDQTKDSRLIRVSESNANIITDINYQELKPENSNNFYKSYNQETFPFVEIKSLPNVFFVSRIKITSNNISKQRDFRYEGLVNHVQGLGVLGFKKSYHSSWYKQMKQFHF